jgi:phosphonate transport system substrate-binding protein
LHAREPDLRELPIRLLACLLVLIAGIAVFPVRAANDPHVLVLGCLSSDPKSDYDQLKPLLDYVVPRMAGVGIREGRILMARDLQQMGSYMRRGRVDWVTGSSATGMTLQSRASARPLLVTERDGVARDHSVFFVRRDSGIATMRDLRGRSIAFRDQTSTDAYFVPATQLLEQGMSLQRLLSPKDHPESSSIGFVLGGTELNIATWVHRRLVDSGAMSDADWRNPQYVPPSFRTALKVIGESGEYPLAMEMVRGDLDAKVQARLQAILLDAANDPDARDALLHYARTTRFLPIDPATGETLARLRAAIVHVRAEAE